jgi:hypothetical protein
MAAPGGTLRIETQSNTAAARIRKIELFGNGKLITTLRQVSNSGNLYIHQYSWNGAGRGRFSLKAVLTEMSGASSTSSPISVTFDYPSAINITSPVDGTSFSLGTTVDINFSVSETEGYLTRLDYYANGNLIESTTAFIKSGNQTYKWQNPQEGIYSFVIVATNDLGVTSTSNSVNIGINRPIPKLR